MCQWVPLTALSVENFRSIVASFGQNFAHVSVWNTATDIALVGSNDPFQLSMEQLAERLGEPRVARQLRWIDLADPKPFLAQLAVETNGVENFSRDAFINTDDNLYLEFSSPLAIGKMCRARNICGMAGWYPGRIDTVESWPPLFETAREATRALRDYRARRPPTRLKKYPKLPGAGN